MKHIIFLVSLLFLAGCESQFDKCLDAELVKIKNAEVELIASHPVLGAYVEMDKHLDQLPDVVRAFMAGRMEAGSGPEKCASMERPWEDEDCKAFRDAQQQSGEDAVDSVGLSDVWIAMGAVQSADFDYRWDDANRDFAERYDSMREALKESFADLPEDDIETQVIIQVKSYEADRKFYFEEIFDPLRVKDPEKQATEICNQRGLYK